MSSLLLIGTVLGFVILLLTAVLRRRWVWVACAFGLVAGYFVLLLGVSLTSRERVVAAGDPMKFCAADCDLWMAVDGIEKRPDGYAVRVRVRSTAARVTMRPDSPEARVYDEAGRRYAASDELDPEPFSRPVGPGESYVKTLLFRLPGTVRDPKLFLNEGGWITRIVIGDDNSLLHKKTLIRLSRN